MSSGHGAFPATGDADHDFLYFRKGKSLFLEVKVWVVQSDLKLLISFYCNHALKAFIVLDQNQFLQ